MPAKFSDTFDRTDSTDLGANWDSGYTGLNNLQIVGNAIRSTVANQDSVESMNAAALTANQYARAKLPVVLTGNVENAAFLCLRFAAPPTNTKYSAVAYGGLNPGNHGRIQLLRHVNGTFGQIANEFTTFDWAAGDVFEFRVVGSLLTALRNGQVLLMANDTNIPTGSRAGAGCFVWTGQSVANAQLDDFECGNLPDARRHRFWFFGELAHEVR